MGQPRFQGGTTLPRILRVGPAIFNYLKTGGKETRKDWKREKCAEGRRLGGGGGVGERREVEALGRRSWY